MSDHGWNRAGFFLTWAASSPVASQITLICFGAPYSLIGRFERLATHPQWQDLLTDPYGLFVIVLNELYFQIDATRKSLASVFRHMELVGKLPPDGRDV